MGLASAAPLEPSLAPFDVLIKDITESSFVDIARDLGHKRLSPADGFLAFPIKGSFYGPSNRIFLPLVVSSAKRGPINVLFLVDTGAPMSFLREDTLEALGFTESIPSSATVLIQGLRISVGLSSESFANVDLLGQDFLTRMGGLLTVNYRDFSCELSFLPPLETGGETPISTYR